VPIQLILQVMSGQTSPVQALPVLLGLALALVAGIAFHEFSHAFTAYRLGDPTPLYQGRVTLNPSAHLDPMGMIFFVLAGFGWGKPVQFNPYHLRTNPRTGSGLVAFAGPLSNIILGTVVGLALRFMLPVFGAALFDSAPLQVALGTIAVFVYFNFLLAIFNLVPLPPLDGSKILPALLPPDMAYGLESFYARAGPFALILLFALFWFAGGVIAPILYGPVQALFQLVVGTGLFY
jgi:Zn-dependent protease